LQYRLPEEVAEELQDIFFVEDVMDRLADPALARIVAEACWFAFEHGRPGYSPTSERKYFMRKYIADRALPLPLIGPVGYTS
jgi:hypothetical protein